MMRTVALAAALASGAAALDWTGDVDMTKTTKEFMGLGGLSGGGGTTRLLYDYKEPQRGQVLDALFSPKAGGNVQILKVEIGGDGQSTEATEASHMHTRTDLNYERGYEWWLMKEAKARNPDVKLYGLSWAVPGWIGDGCKASNCSMDEQYYWGEDNIDYHLKWLDGAKSAHNLTIDYLGCEQFCSLFLPLFLVFARCFVLTFCSRFCSGSGTSGRRTRTGSCGSGRRWTKAGTRTR